VDCNVHGDQWEAGESRDEIASQMEDEVIARCRKFDCKINCGEEMFHRRSIGNYVCSRLKVVNCGTRDLRGHFIVILILKRSHSVSF